jgi:hypothetical protein
MTGIEAAALTAAVGNAVAKAASKDAAEQRSVKSAMLEAVKNTPEFKRAVSLYGERLALRQGVSTGLFRLFAKVLPIRSEYLESQAALDFAGKILTIPDEDLQPPKRSVAGPAFEGLGHAVDEPELRNLFLELLARAVDSKYADAAHPSFVEVIRQITSREAELLKVYLTGQAGTSVPIVTLNSSISPGLGSIRLYTHLLNIRNEQDEAAEFDVIPTYVDNWVRLGLVEVTYDAYLTRPEAYSWVDSRPETLNAQLQVSSRIAPAVAPGEAEEVYMLDIQKGHMTPTAFGKSFALAVGMYGALGDRSSIA